MSKGRLEAASEEAPYVISVQCSRGQVPELPPRLDRRATRRSDAPGARRWFHFGGLPGGSSPCLGATVPNASCEWEGVSGPGGEGGALIIDSPSAPLVFTIWNFDLARTNEWGSPIRVKPHGGVM